MGFDPVANRLVFERVFKPMFGGEIDMKVVWEMRERLKGALDGVERSLEGRRWMSGEVS